MKTIYFSTLSLILIFLASCSDEKAPTNKSELTDKEIILEKYEIFDLPDDFKQLGITGLVRVNKGVLPNSPAKVKAEFLDYVGVGSLYINGVKIDKVSMDKNNGDDDGKYFWYQCDCNFNYSRNNNLIQLDGSGYPDFSVFVDTPPKITVSNVDLSEPVSFNDDLQIEWETSDEYKYVAVILMDDEKYSGKYFREGNSAILRAAELQDFNKDEVTLTVAAYNYNFVKVNHEKKDSYVLGLLAYTEVHHLSFTN